MDFIAVIIGSLFATAFFSGLAIIVYLAVADIFGRAVRFAEVVGFKSGPHNSASWSSYKFSELPKVPKEKKPKKPPKGRPKERSLVAEATEYSEEAMREAERLYKEIDADFRKNWT
jgi:hypothetical protein